MSSGKVPDVANEGIARHPKYFGAKVLPGMELPGDTRLLRDVKLREVPTWLGKQNLSPLGLWFGFRRFRERWMTKYLHVRRPTGIYFAQTVAVLSIIGYCFRHEFYKRTEQRRKYH